MNRKSRRKTAATQRKIGDVIFTQTIIAHPAGNFYWFECDRSFDPRQGVPSDAKLHGPFKTDAEVKEDQRRVLLGPDCTLEEGGQWDPAWDKPQ